MLKFVNSEVKRRGALGAAGQSAKLIREITTRFDVSRQVAGQALATAIKTLPKPALTAADKIKRDRLAGKRRRVNI